jgi:hypothetical protein
MNAPIRMTEITMATLSPHERAARAHDIAAEAHEQAEALVERNLTDPSEENEIIEVQQCSDAFLATQAAHQATVEANQLGGFEKGAELSSEAALHEAHAAGEADAGSEDALKRHRATGLAHRAASASHRAGE